MLVSRLVVRDEFWPLNSRKAVRTELLWVQQSESTPHSTTDRPTADYQSYRKWSPCLQRCWLLRSHLSQISTSSSSCQNVLHFGFRLPENQGSSPVTWAHGSRPLYMENIQATTFVFGQRYTFHRSRKCAAQTVPNSLTGTRHVATVTTSVSISP